MTRQGWPILGPHASAMSLHRWEMEQHCIAGGTLDQRTHCGSIKADDQVTFPVTRNGTIISLSRTFTDHDLRSNEMLSSLLRPGSRHTKCTARTQTRSKLLPQSATALNVKRLIDGFVRDSHGLVFWIVGLQSSTDLFGTPAGAPTTVRAAALPSSFPGYVGPGNRPAL